MASIDTLDVAPLFASHELHLKPHVSVSLRRPRSRRSAALLVMVLSALLLTSCTTKAPHRAPAHLAPVSVTVTLARTSGPAGTPLNGEMIIRNRTGATISVGGCGVDALLEVGLTNSRVPFNPLSGAVACMTRFAPGVTRTTISVATTYAGCGGDGFPQCPRHGILALPPGRYQTIVNTIGMPHGTSFGTPLRVTLY